MILKNSSEYFATARERYLIKIRREQGWERPYTGDPYFRDWRFCNVFREDDKTTVWFRENIRSKVSHLNALKAILIFRWFNRIETGEIIKPLILEGGWSTEEAHRLLEDQKPLVTGAYMIRTLEGLDKLDGVLYYIEHALPHLDTVDFSENTLESVWQQLLDIHGLGPFLAYEIVSDMRWCEPLTQATDINTWANAGPGCAQGIGRVVSGDRKQYNRHNDQEQLLEIMTYLHAMAQNENNWPWQERKWEMREVEHWACEYEKWCKARDGRKLKRKF